MSHRRDGAAAASEMPCGTVETGAAVGVHVVAIVNMWVVCQRDHVEIVDDVKT
jgi:hypothetical protein